MKNKMPTEPTPAFSSMSNSVSFRAPMAFLILSFIAITTYANFITGIGFSPIGGFFLSLAASLSAAFLSPIHYRS